MASSDEVRGALETRRAPNGGGDVVTANRSLAVTVRRVIDRQADELRLVLPPSMDADRFARLTISAVKATPKLMLAFGSKQGEQSVLLAAMEAATVGLEPNTPLQHAWLVPRKDHGVWEARFWIGYRGLLTLIHRGGAVREVVAGVVHENDEFGWGRELDRDTLTHRPGGDNRGKATHVYAIARLINGGAQFEVLTRAEVEKRREQSDGWKDAKSRPYSPWTKWPDAMWKKSAVRALVPWLDLSHEAAGNVGHALAADGRRLQLDDDLVLGPADDEDLDAGADADDAGDVDESTGPAPATTAGPEPDPNPAES